MARDWKFTVTGVISDQPDQATDAQLHLAVMRHIVETYQLSPPDGETTIHGIALDEIK